MPKFSTKKFEFKTNIYIRILIVLLTVILITLMFPGLESVESDYSIGTIWSKEDLIAPFSFPIYKNDNTYNREVEEAKSKVLPVFDQNILKAEGKINWFDSLGLFWNKLQKALSYETEMKKESSLPEEKRTTSEQTMLKLKSDLRISFTSDEWNSLLGMWSSSQASMNEARRRLVLALNQISGRKIIDVPKSRIKTGEIAYYLNRVEETISLDKLSDRTEALNIIRNDLAGYFKDDRLVSAFVGIAGLFIYLDFIYNDSETRKIMDAMASAVPHTLGIVRENERIISKHEPINELTRLKLESYKKIRSEQMGSKDFYLQQLGRFMTVLILLTLAGMFLYKMRKRIYGDNTKLILISTIILLQVLFSYLSLHIKIDYPIEYLIFVPVSAMLLTIIFDSRLSFYFIIIICFLVSLIRGGDYEIIIPNFAASVLVIYSVRDIKKRSQIFLSMVFILAGYLISIIAMGLERNDSITVVRHYIYMAALNSLLSPILAYGLLIFYERVFRIATDLLYLELSDFNHPLLRELSTKAPGTFHHSIVMGNLSEQAAKEISANQILARVGCYYHDIGKVVSPEYFVENQIDSRSKHEQLNPTLSAKMIIAHVRNGIKLAEKFRIPREIIDFIPMHHGTNLVSYFYEKARSDDGTEDVIHDYIYRYPGPKPQSRETGIVMLADAVEAVTRTIEEPTPAKLETQIDEIIKARFLDGELDECDLTLKDLIKIKQSFLLTLVGIHHHRIKYPEGDEETDEQK